MWGRRVKSYRHADHNTGVVAYEDGPGFIRVKFVDGGVYLYTSESTGADRITDMQQLAARGRGLSTYINRYVREDYAERERAQQ